MPSASSPSRRATASDITRQALFALFLTSAHHAYGAYLYHTPWRYHVLLIAAPAALVIVGSQAVIRSDPTSPRATVARGVFALTTLALPVIAFGAFEGFYNHVMKNVLYFSGVSAAVMARLFPPPMYEMPNNLVFEITGVLQVVPAVLIVERFVRMRRARRPSTATGAAAR